MRCKYFVDSEVVYFSVFEYNPSHLSRTLLHLLVMLLLPLLLRLNRVHYVVRLTLLDELKLSYHALDHTLFYDEKHANVQHSE